MVRPTRKEVRAARGVDRAAAAQRALQAQRELRVITDVTEASHQRAIAYFKEYLEELHEGGPDERQLYHDWAGERSVEEALKKNTDLTLTIPILHGFTEHHCQSAVGRLEKAEVGELPPITVNTACVTVRTLGSAFWRLSRAEHQQGKVVNSACNFVKGVLKGRLGLSEVTRLKRTPDAIVLKGKWTTTGMMARCFYPETTFSYNIERLHFVLTVNLQVTTASRIGSIMLSSAYKIKDEHARRALCWGHARIDLFRDELGAGNHLMVTLTSKYAKTEAGQGLRYRMFEFDVPLFNGPLLLVILGVLLGVFKGNPTLDAVLDPSCISTDRDHAELHVKDEFLDAPIISQTLPTDLLPDSVKCHGDVVTPHIALTANRYNRILEKLSNEEGYLNKITSHDLRAMVITSRLQSNGDSFQSLQHAIGHRIGTDTWTKYVRNDTLENFQSVVLGDLSVQDKLAKINDMRLEQTKDRPQTISATGKAQIAAHPAMLELVGAQGEHRLHMTRRHGSMAAAPEEEQKKDRDYYGRGRSLYKKLYRKIYRAEVEQHYRDAVGARFEQNRPTNSTALPPDVEMPTIEDPDMAEQFDDFLPAEAVEHDLGVGIEILAVTDFNQPSHIIQLLSAGRSDEEALQWLAQSMENGVDQVAATPLTEHAAENEPGPPDVPAALSEAISSETWDQSITTDSTDTTSTHTPSMLMGSSESKSAAEDPLSAAARLGLEAGADRVEFANSVLGMSVLGFETRGFLPNLGPVLTGETYSCPTCGVTGAELAEKKSGSLRVSRSTGGAKPAVRSLLAEKAQQGEAIAYNKLQDPASTPSPTSSTSAKGRSIASSETHLLRTHILQCEIEKKHQDSYQEVADSFDQTQPCPMCPDGVDATKTFKTPTKWAEHADCHIGAVCCGKALPTAMMVTEHMLTHHQILARKANSSDTGARRRTSLTMDDIPLPEYSTFDHSIYVHPADFVMHLYDMLETRFKVKAGPWLPRDDRTKDAVANEALDKATQALESLVPAPIDGEVDERFHVIAANKMAGVVIKAGFCPVCVYDERLPIVQRLLGFESDISLRKHVATHFYSKWADHEAAIAAGQAAPHESCPEAWNHLALHHNTNWPRPGKPRLGVASNSAELREVLADTYVKSGSSLPVRYGIITDPSLVGKNHQKYLDQETAKDLRARAGSKTRRAPQKRKRKSSNEDSSASESD